MSSPWMNKTAIQNHNGSASAFPSNSLDSNVFNNSAHYETPFDASSYANQLPLQQQRMPHGSIRNGSAGSYNQSQQYQTNSLVPSKRGREDNFGTSPQQTPGMLPHSRSHTPQQNAYSGYQANAQSSQHTPQQISYAHLQDAPGNATPSPVMSSQIRPAGIPQRVSTVSPHPYSPAASQFPHLSPAQSDQGGSSQHESAQQNNQYASNPVYTQGFGQTFTPPPGQSPAPPPPHTMTTPHIPQSQPSQVYQQRQQGQTDQQRLIFQMQLQQQLQQRNMLAQRANLPSNPNVIPPQQMPAPNGQYSGARLSPAFPAARMSPNPENFMKNLVSFMQGKKLSLEMNPMFGNRPVPLASLYYTVVKFGGYKRVTAINGWESVAAALQLHPIEHISAPQYLKGVYERNLVLFEEALTMNQQRQRFQMLQQNPNISVPQISPTKTKVAPPATMQDPLHSYTPQHQQSLTQQIPQPQQQLPALATPIKQKQSLQPQQHQPPSTNGFSTLPTSKTQIQQTSPQPYQRENQTKALESTPPKKSMSISSPVSSVKPSNLEKMSPEAEKPANVPLKPQKHKLPSEYKTKVVILDTYGGAELSTLARLGGDRMRFKPDAPLVGDMGTIDMHALTMSLQSGIHSEIRLALDSLVCLSVEPRIQLDLRACEDLLETLVDCAEVQVELLAGKSGEAFDVMRISSYEDLVRQCRLEQKVLQDIPVFGSWEYELDRAAERLICITTILRNLSFYDTNHPQLTEKLVLRFFCTAIRYLGTRKLLLRTSSNTLDFMKDAVIFLSNLAQEIELSGKEEALYLLHFILAFAPYPPPNNANTSTIVFSPYDPAIHRYLPPAVDSLAKLLARDEPNRSLFKAIFAAEVTSIPPYNLLTRAFALAVSSVPDDGPDTTRAKLPPIIESRKPFLMQGILAAGILSNLAPGFEAGVAKSWLTSEDGFSHNLCRLIITLCLEVTPNAPHQRQAVITRSFDDDALLQIILGSIAVLHRLVEKSRNPQDPVSGKDFSQVLAKESLLAAMNTVQPRLQGVLKRLCVFAGLES
ncbi:ARID/BRIGHT domain protein (SWI1) [Blumeria hordei DH14]|uniref:ARID/BRIGHT domain protein (SWI1) n=1 Tax=Blumeria graminis f. sp. hordei (strain DH14) TaxID=546991 RepID=N1J7B7_BLUG1|nr:ARID/BRIGHT domain protein (SWI1) [Blumeria hordei DH14]